MPDFTSALYLGLGHASHQLKGWEQLSLGRPAILEEPPGAGQVAANLSQLQGMEASVLLPSTLHLFVDAFECFATAGSAIYLDDANYPITRWGAERAILRGIPLRSFARRDPRDLLWQLAQGAREGLRPLVVADGICPATGQVAPLGEYLEIVRHFGGLLLIDDTQALGLLGRNPDKRRPYGYGGGGVPGYLGLTGADLLIGASLAKAFGAPVAALSGSQRLIQRFKAGSLSRLHCSPPSVAVIQAAARALAVNIRYGDQLRAQLAENILHFRQGLGRLDISVDGGLFPVQTLAPPGVSAISLQEALEQQHIKTLLLKSRADSPARLGFVINARHSASDIDACVESLGAILKSRGKKRVNS
ncbi:MAG: hypothetical protein B0W54_09905 [Cellvibrio sp. 79]|nr:MAG: hypothetical protein B0W54_09905 [Cellvibrio sp. 79]